MEYQCPHCGADISENDIFQGACPKCKKVIDFSTVKKIRPEEPVQKEKPPEPQKSTCSFCHKQIPREAEFCPHCGKSVSGETQPEAPANPSAISLKNILAGLVVSFRLRNYQWSHERTLSSCSVLLEIGLM